MSYKTNPILNRLKVIKGWKNPYLPTKTLNYTRDIALWFKVYLLLKTFLNLKKMQLFSYEIRFEQQNKKLLYLGINKKKNQRKKRKRKNIFLKKIKTPFRKHINANSIFFLYHNLFFLKKISFWNQDLVQKKVLSKFWLTKPKISTWINTLEKITDLRQNSKKKLKYLQKNQNFTPVQYIKLKFYTNKQTKILTQKFRIKKMNIILYAKLFELLQQENSQLLQKFIKNIKKKIDQNQVKIQKINQLYTFLWHLNKNSYKKETKRLFFKNSIVNGLHRRKTAILQKLITKEISSFNRTKFLKQKLPMFLLKINSQLFSHPLLGKFLKNEFLFKNILKLNFLIAKIQNKSLINNNHLWIFKTGIQKKKVFLEKLNLKTILKSRFRYTVNKKKRHCLLDRISVWFLLRRNQKKKKFSKKLNKNKKFRLKKTFLKKYLSFWNTKKYCQKKIKYRFAKDIKAINKYVKKSQVVKTYQYKIPYRKNYFNFLRLNTKLKLKYLIQDFVQNYFSLQVEAKIVHFLNEHKNQNYFRLVFPVWKKKKKQLIKKFRRAHWKQKQLFLTSQLKLATLTKKGNFEKTKSTLFANKISKVLKKKDLYLLARKKIKNLRLKNYFKRIKNNKDFRHSFKYFIPTLMYFSKTLDPQLLADLFAKVLYKAKKQTWMLNTIKDILKMLKLGKNVGYKITLAGRINSADKSRLVYITRKNVPLQVFDKNMNFAYSQAKARIGVFGIKIWVFF